MTAPKTTAPATTKPDTAPKAKAKRTDETPAQRFKRLGTARIRKAVAMLRRIETIGKSKSYEFTTDQANSVMKYLDESVERVRLAFVNRVNDKPEDSISL